MDLRGLGLSLGVFAVGCGPNLVPNGQSGTETDGGSSGSTTDTTTSAGSSTSVDSTTAATEPDASSGSGSDDSSTGPDIAVPGCWSTIARRASGLGDVWSDGQNAVAVGDTDLIVFDGNTWTEHVIETSASLVAGRAVDDLWLAGRWGLLHWDGTTASSMLDPKVYGEVPGVTVGSDGAVWALAAPLESCGEFGCLETDVLELVDGSWVERGSFDRRLSGITIAAGETWAGSVGQLHHLVGEDWIDVPLPEGDLINDVITDSADRIWVAAANGIWSLENDAWTHWYSDAPTHRLAIDREGAVWGLEAFDDGVGGDEFGRLLRPILDGYTAVTEELQAEQGFAWLDDGSALVAGEAGGHVVQQVVRSGVIAEEPSYFRETAGGTHRLFATDDDTILGPDTRGLQIGIGNAWTRDPLTAATRLNAAVWAASANDVWLGGDDSRVPLLGFDGSTFSPRPWSPRATNDDRVFGIWGSSPTSVWVAGGRSEVPVIGPGGVGFIEHWDGSAWSDETPDGLDQVYSVTGRGDAVFAATYTQLLQRTGDGWTEVSLPFTPSSIHRLAVANANDLWLLELPGLGGVERGFGLWHWNGSDWSDRAAELPNFSELSEARTLSANASGQAWLAWRHRPEPTKAAELMLARFSDGAWEVEPTPEGAAYVSGLAATSDGAVLDAFLTVHRFAPCE